MATVIKQQTQIATVRQQMADQMKAVCEALSWTEDQFCQHQFEEYELFVSAVARDYPNRYNQLRYSPVFRGFFVNEWAKRNAEDFLPYIYDVKYDLELAEQEYLFIHGYMTLINDDTFFTRFANLLKLI